MIGALFAILIIVADILFFHFTMKGESIHNKIAWLIMVMPFVHLFFSFIFNKLYSLVEIYDFELPKSEKPKNYISQDTVSRCEAILRVADAVKNSDSALSYNSTIGICCMNIERYVYRDSFKANLYCNELEELFVSNKTVVAQIPVGYMWLRSIGEI